MLSDCGHATSSVAFRHLGYSAGNLKPLKDCPLFTALRAFRHTQHVRAQPRNAVIYDISRLLPHIFGTASLLNKVPPFYIPRAQSTVKYNVAWSRNTRVACVLRRCCA